MPMAMVSQELANEAALASFHQAALEPRHGHGGLVPCSH